MQKEISQLISRLLASLSPVMSCKGCKIPPRNSSSYCRIGSERNLPPGYYALLFYNQWQWIFYNIHVNLLMIIYGSNWKDTSTTN